LNEVLPEQEPFSEPLESDGRSLHEAIIDRIFNPHPLVIVISGPSGVGKDETLNRMEERGVGFHFVVTTPPRPRRAGEVDGRDYHFVTVDEFAGMIDRDELLEYAVVYGDYKGIPKQQVRDALASGLDVVLRIDVQGARTIRQLLPEAIFIFLMAESFEELERRLLERKTDAADRLKMRIATARQEMRRVVEFDYVVVNRRDEMDVTVDFIEAIIKAEKHLVHARQVEL
jgi:guanylate kinase